MYVFSVSASPRPPLYLLASFLLSQLWLSPETGSDWAVATWVTNTSSRAGVPEPTMLSSMKPPKRDHLSNYPKATQSSEKGIMRVTMF